MADGGVKIGLPRELAVTIATETISVNDFSSFTFLNSFLFFARFEDYLGDLVFVLIRLSS